MKQRIRLKFPTMVDTIIHIYKKQLALLSTFNYYTLNLYSLITVINIFIQLTAVFGILAVVAIGSGLFFRYNSFSFTAWLTFELQFLSSIFYLTSTSGHSSPLSASSYSSCSSLLLLLLSSQSNSSSSLTSSYQGVGSYSW